MDLPAPLRRAVEEALEGVSLADLAAAAARLSERYRGEVGGLHLSDALAAKAYLATRLPATYAAVRASLEAAAEALPSFRPLSLLDLGAGPGTAFFAAADCWPGLERATLVEASPAIRAAGERLAAGAGYAAATWRAGDVAAPGEAAADLVTLTYVLGELPAEKRATVVDRAWALSSGLFVIVEPGTPAGWQRILDARARLIAAGAHVIVPCPHDRACPLAPPDWCHFAERLARSRLHRLAKGGEAPFEDEKYAYIALSRAPAERHAARVLAPPRMASGRVTLKLCRPDGSAADRLFTRREGDAWRVARRAGWGDALVEPP